jgi:hypothetical protein
VVDAASASSGGRRRLFTGAVSVSFTVAAADEATATMLSARIFSAFTANAALFVASLQAAGVPVTSVSLVVAPSTSVTASPNSSIRDSGSTLGAAIGGGVGGGIALLIFGCIFFLIRKRKQQGTDATAQQPVTGVVYGVTMMPIAEPKHVNLAAAPATTKIPDVITGGPYLSTTTNYRALYDWLVEHNIEDAMATLQNAGAKMPSDLKHLTDADYNNLALSIISRNKLRAAVQQEFFAGIKEQELVQ